jgi:hypothetical protein
MDTLKGIEKLAQWAVKEEIPAFDVTGKVLPAIRAEEAERVSLIPFDIFAAVSAAAASVILFLGINAWLYFTDPLTGLFAPLQEIALW